MNKEDVSQILNEVESLEFNINLLAPKIKALREHFRYNPSGDIATTSSEIISSYSYMDEIVQVRLSLQELEEYLYEEDNE